MQCIRLWYSGCCVTGRLGSWRMGTTKCLNRNGLRDICNLCMPDFFSMLFAFFLTAGFWRFFAISGQNRWLASGEKTGKCGQWVVIGAADFGALGMVRG